MPVIDDFKSLFSIGQYSLCNTFKKEKSNQKDDLYNQWMNTCKEVSSQFMTVYIENDVITKEKTGVLCQHLQDTVQQIRSAPINEKMLQIELSALYSILYITTLTNGLIQTDDEEVQVLLKESLVRVIYHQNWRPCNEKEEIEELLLKVIKQTQNDALLSVLVCLSCLWAILQSLQDKSGNVLPLMDQCLKIQNLKNLVFPDLILLPVSLLLTGNQFEENPSISDVVNMTTGIVYYKTDHEKARQCLQLVNAVQYKPYTVYLIGRIEYIEEHYLDVLTTLCNLPEDVVVTSRVKSLHCHLFGLALSKLGKHQCAIQKYKEALEHDFDFLLPLYMISLEYRSLNMTPAELESLNLMATTLETVKAGQTHSNNSLFMALLDDTCRQLTLSQVLYAMAYRCSQLHMYDDASQRFLDLLSEFQENDSIQMSSNSLVQIPSVSMVYKEAIHCLHHAKKYTDCISFCDRILNCLPLNPHNASVDINSQFNHSNHDHSGIINTSDIVDKMDSQDGYKRKRQNSEDLTSKNNEFDIDIYLYKADSLVLLDRPEDAVQCLDRCCKRIPFCPSSSLGVSVHHQSKRRRMTSDGDASSHTEVTEHVCSIQNFASSVYCHIGVAVATKGLIPDALHFLHLALRFNPGNKDVLYNYAVVLWKLKKKEAAIAWCQGRDIETVSDSFHLSNILKQKQNKLRSLTGKEYFRETDLVPTNDVNDEQLLKLDVLCLNFLLSSFKRS